MLIALFGSIDPSTLKPMVDRGHQFLVSDSPRDKDTVAALVELRAPHAVVRAAWSNLDHPRSVEDARMGDNGLETYNKNGGFVRDAQMVERADAVVVGEGVSPNRMALIDQEATEHNRPVRNVVPVRPEISREEVEAELEACFATEQPKPKPKPKKRGKAEVKTEAEAEVIPF